MFEQFQKFVPKITNQLALTPALTAAHICQLARKFFDQNHTDLSPYLTVASFKNHTLKIYCQNSSALQELHFLKPTLLTYLKSQHPTPIKKILGQLDPNEQKKGEI